MKIAYWHPWRDIAVVEISDRQQIWIKAQEIYNKRLPEERPIETINRICEVPEGTIVWKDVYLDD
jgi:hypothetical protein